MTGAGTIQAVNSVYVAGHKGLVGSALVRALESRQISWMGKSHNELDLLDRDSVFQFIGDTKPEAVIIAAAKVGGIVANDSQPVEFLSENIRISANIIDACHSANVSRVLFLGSSCIYPRMAPQPIKEEYLLTGPLEPTNESYALAKISGLKLIQAYRRQYGHNWISAMPTNLYGPGDNFDLQSSHVLPATIRKFATAVKNGSSIVDMWGTGSPRREFLHVDDLANACLHLLNNYNEDICINVGTGTDVEIRELAQMVSEIIGFTGEIRWDTTKPDGMPRKLLDVTRINSTGWHSKIALEDGLKQVFSWYQKNIDVD
jgi:GDP-L-fucose synthase